MGRKCATGCLGEAGGAGSNNSSATSLPLQHQLAVQGAGALAPGRNKADHTSPFSEFSLDSLPSFCSDYNEHVRPFLNLTPLSRLWSLTAKLFNLNILPLKVVFR